MRLPFPERIPVLYAAYFAAALCAVQLVEGTSGIFALCSFLFIVISALTFNLAGGFTQTSGAYVFFYATLTVIVGIFWKAVLGEPGDLNLSAPIVTMLIYVASASGLFAAVYISGRLRTKRGVLMYLLPDSNMQSATIGCMVAGLTIVLLDLIGENTAGSLVSALRQMDNFLPVAIILGVRHQIRKSGGTSSISVPVVLSFLIVFAQGLIGFSKQGMFTPFVCWLVAAASLRYRVSWLQVGGGILTAVFIFQYLVPYSQYGRNYRTTTLSDNISAAITLLPRLGYVREQYKAEEAEDTELSPAAYYSTPQGFFDRLQMIGIDDALINITEQGHVYGLSPIMIDLENMVPHFLWPNKPTIVADSEFAHEIGGIIPEGDTSTGIAFGLTAVCFHLAEWPGVLVIAPILWVVLFTLFDSLCGDTRVSPWGLLMVLLFAHVAPESGFDGLMWVIGYGAEGLLFTAICGAYVVPVVGTALAGPRRTVILRGLRVRSVPRSVPGVSSSKS